METSILAYPLFFIIIFFVYILLEVLGKIFLREHEPGDDIVWDYICPRCGSPDWKFPNPLNGTDNIFNYPSQVHLLYECTDCQHIGIFFKVAHDEVARIKFSKKNIKHKTTGLPIFYSLLIIIIFFFVGGFFYGPFISVFIALSVLKAFQPEET
jgi:hypothetical protein